MKIADAGFLLGTQGPPAEGAGLEIALGDFTDAEIFAHDLAVGLDGALARGVLGAVREIEMINEPGALAFDGKDARGVHAVRINRQGHVGIRPKPDAAID